MFYLIGGPSHTGKTNPAQKLMVKTAVKNEQNMIPEGCVKYGCEYKLISDKYDVDEEIFE